MKILETSGQIFELTPKSKESLNNTDGFLQGFGSMDLNNASNRKYARATTVSYDLKFLDQANNESEGGPSHKCVEEEPKIEDDDVSLP